MSDLRLFRSTYFRFSIVLSALFVAAYISAGFVAYRAIHANLDKRVQQSVALTHASFKEISDRGGPEELAAAVGRAADTLDPEDDIVWLGDRKGVRLAGHDLPALDQVTDGDVGGLLLGQDSDDTYLVARKPVGDLTLIVARSYEETDDIAETVLNAFAGATLLAMLLASSAGLALSRRGQKRIDDIAGALKKVAGGDLAQRVPRPDGSDDLAILAQRTNEALSQLEANVLGIREVSANIAHDLRTPINRLGIQIERLHDEVTGHPALQVRLEAASAEMRQIASTFDALLRISQIEAGARKAKFRAVSLSAIAQDIHEAYAAVAEDVGQTLILKPPADPNTLVYGDRDLLIQLLSNLVENAVRHAGPDAVIHLETGSDPNGAWLNLSDSGPGIPPGERGSVLGRFYRLDKARHTPGSGLGLALVKAIADLHDARLVLSDAAPGLNVHILFRPFETALKADA